MKLIKFFTGAKVTSYKLKLALHETFYNTKPTNDGLGNNLLKVMQHKELRGSFETVRDELSKLGIEKIVLSQDNICFEGKIWLFDK